MKNTLLALALFAFAGTSAFAHEGKGDHTHGKKGKKEACTTEAKSHCAQATAGTAAMPSCCMKKGAKTAAVTPAEKAPVKAL